MDPNAAEQWYVAGSVLAVARVAEEKNGFDWWRRLVHVASPSHLFRAPWSSSEFHSSVLFSSIRFEQQPIHLDFTSKLRSTQQQSTTVEASATAATLHSTVRLLVRSCARTNAFASPIADRCRPCPTHLPIAYALSFGAAAGAAVPSSLLEDQLLCTELLPMLASCQCCGRRMVTQGAHTDLPCCSLHQRPPQALTARFPFQYILLCRRIC